MIMNKAEKKENVVAVIAAFILSKIFISVLFPSRLFSEAAFKITNKLIVIR